MPPSPATPITDRQSRFANHQSRIKSKRPAETVLVGGPGDVGIPAGTAMPSTRSREPCCNTYRRTHRHAGRGRRRQKPARNLKTFGKSYAQQHRQGKGLRAMIFRSGNGPYGCIERGFLARLDCYDEHERVFWIPRILQHRIEVDSLPRQRRGHRCQDSRPVSHDKPQVIRSQGRADERCGTPCIEC